MVMFAPRLIPVIARQKAFQSSRIGVQGFEHARPAGPDFVLRLAGAERFGEMAPERIQPLVRHLENAADVGRLLPVEKEVRLGVFAYGPRSA